ncbi:MAG: transcription termination factor Rho [Actinomycetaceae bacterium]|nr:transcription termination factor Rho [Actinomycetaceae bacterium]
MRLADLRAYAEELGIELSPKAKRPEIQAAIREVLPARRGRSRKDENLPLEQQGSANEQASSIAPEAGKSEEVAANEKTDEQYTGPATVEDIVLPEPSGAREDAATTATRSRTRSRNRNRNRNNAEQGAQRQDAPVNNAADSSNADNANEERAAQRARTTQGGQAQAQQRQRSDRNNQRAQAQAQAQNQNNTDNAQYAQQEEEYLIPVAGILDKQGNQFFLRTGGYLPGTNDAFVTPQIIKQYSLRRGDAIVGAVREPSSYQNRRNNNRRGNNNRYYNQPRHNQLVQVDSINGLTPEKSAERPEFNKLTPLYPQEMIRLETDSKGLTTRAIDLVAPIGKGQRGLIVSPPKAGKTLMMQQIAMAIAKNDPDVHIMVVLVDERPEEVTDMQRLVKGEVISSTFDRPASDHTIVAELAIERAKRLVELGQDVVVLLDSLTRLSRAYNLAAPTSGRILSGGVDAAALYPPKKFFGAARNIEDGGSLTIIASALVETGSKMDEVIFEEFKGTGNMELRLSRQLADRRIFPAIDVNASGTRREELLYTPQELKVIWQLRRGMGKLEVSEASDFFLNRLRKTESNGDFLVSIMRQMQNS